MKGTTGSRNDNFIHMTANKLSAKVTANNYNLKYLEKSQWKMFTAAIEFFFDKERVHECCNMPFVFADLFALTWVKDLTIFGTSFIA